MLAECGRAYPRGNGVTALRASFVIFSGGLPPFARGNRNRNPRREDGPGPIPVPRGNLRRDGNRNVLLGTILACTG